MTNYVGSAVGGAVLGSLVALIVNRKHKDKNVVGHAIAGAGVALGLTVVTKVVPDPLKKPLLFAQGKGAMFGTAVGWDQFHPHHEEFHPHHDPFGGGGGFQPQRDPFAFHPHHW